MITSVRPPARTAQLNILAAWFGRIAPTHYFHNEREEVYVFGDGGRYLLMATDGDPDTPLRAIGILDTYSELMDYYRQGGYSWVH